MKPANAAQVVEDLVEFEDLLKKSDQAGKDIPDEIYQGIIEGKLDPQQAVKEMNKYTKNEMDKMSPSAEKSGQDAVEKYGQGIGNSNKKKKVGSTAESVAQYGVDEGFKSVSTYGSGTYFVQGFINGMNDPEKRRIAINTASNIAVSALNALRAAGQEGSPWKTTTQSGKWFGEGFANGIDRMITPAEKSAENLSEKAIAALGDGDIEKLFDFSPEHLNQAIARLRKSANVVIGNIIDSAMIPSSKNISLAKRDNEQFVPRSIELISSGKQQIILQLQNGQEIAHWLAPDISKELGIMR